MTTRLSLRTFASLAALTMALAGILLVGGPASAKTWEVPSADPSLDPVVNLTEFENRIAIKINKARNAQDLKPVRYFDSCVDGFAERWARHLASTGEFAHRDQRQILNDCGLTWVGETLVRGTALTPGSAVRAWLDSPAHRAVILKPRATRAGIGVRLDGEGRLVGVLNFGDHN